MLGGAVPSASSRGRPRNVLDGFAAPLPQHAQARVVACWMLGGAVPSASSRGRPRNVLDGFAAPLPQHAQARVVACWMLGGAVPSASSRGRPRNVLDGFAAPSPQHAQARVVACWMLGGAVPSASSRGRPRNVLDGFAAPSPQHAQARVAACWMLGGAVPSASSRGRPRNVLDGFAASSPRRVYSPVGGVSKRPLFTTRSGWRERPARKCEGRRGPFGSAIASAHLHSPSRGLAPERAPPESAGALGPLPLDRRGRPCVGLSLEGRDSCADEDVHGVTFRDGAGGGRRPRAGVAQARTTRPMRAPIGRAGAVD